MKTHAITNTMGRRALLIGLSLVAAATGGFGAASADSVSDIKAKGNATTQRWAIQQPGNKAEGQVIDHFKPQIFEGMDCSGPASARRAGDQNDLMFWHQSMFRDVLWRSHCLSFFQACRPPII